MVLPKFLNKEFDTVIIISFIIFTLLWVLFYPQLLNKLVVKRAVIMINEGKNTSILGKHEIEFFSNGIILKEPQIQMKVNWQGIVKFLENENYYFLYISAISAIIIPKHKLNISFDELKILDEILRKNINTAIL